MSFLDHKFKNEDLDNEFAHISTREKVAYGGAEMLGGSLFYFAVLTFSTYFYTDIIGISATLVGSVILISRIFDGITDILTGMLIDRIKNPHGRARMLFFWTNIPLVISMVLIYCCPITSGAGQTAFLIITYNFAVTVMFTLNNIPWNAMPFMLSRDSKQRDSIMFIRMGCSYFGGAIAGAITLPILNAMGDMYNQKNWIILMSIYALVVLIVNFWAVFNLKERVKPVAAARKHAKWDLPSALQNKYFWWAIAVPGLYQTMMTTTMVIMPYYATYVLGDTMLTSRLTSVQSLTIGCIAMIAAMLVVKGVKKGTLLKLGAVIASLAQVALIINPESVQLMTIMSFIRGLGFGFLAAAQYSICGDVIEYGHWRTGHRAEGTISSASGIGNKLSIIIGNGLTTLLIALSGYDGKLAVQSAETIKMIKFDFIWMPMILGAVLLVVLMISKLDKIYPAIMEDLKNGRFHPKAKYAKIYAEEAAAEASAN